MEKFVKSLPQFDFQWFQFNESSETQPPDFLESPTSSSESSSDSSSDDEVMEPRPKTSKVDVVPLDVDEVLVGRYRAVVHALVRAGDDEDWRPRWQGQPLKPACGRQMRGCGSRDLG